MQPPAESVRRGPSPSPLRRRDKSPVKTASGSTYPYEYPAARARPPVERTHPYEYPASRARPAWRSAATEYDDLDEDEDLYGLEPSYTERSSRQEPLDRPSIEPEAAIELDDDLEEDLDLDMFSAYAYANTRRSGMPRDASIVSYRDMGPAARQACARLAERKGKENYAGLASISESIATSMPRSIPIDSSYGRRRSDSPAIPAPMTEVIEADSPNSDTYSAFYLTPLPPLSTTSYSNLPLPPSKRRTHHYISRPIIIPEHTTAIIIAESATTSPTTTTTTTTYTTAATTSTTSASTSTSTAATTDTAPTHTTSNHPPGALTPEPPSPEDEGFSEPAGLDTTEALDQAFLTALARGHMRPTGRRGRVGEAGDVVGEGAAGGGVVRPRVRKRISKRKGPGRRDP
ncbi:hypothetical protein V494_08048 [Pseudogymnoascus sp. VKM F-4513 (FW-928)]|nr:hypothetical protein V494_08048 [Pseudogymnoascus sp. VKM F-4513 (FW-928)]